MKSFAGPYRVGDSTDRPKTCTCGPDWRIDFEINEHSGDERRS